MKIRVALIVGSNGLFAVSPSKDGEPDDWGFMEDCVMDYEKGSDPKMPDATARYYVMLDVPVPTIESIEPEMVIAAV